MEIKLTQSGGLSGKKIEATVNSELSEKEWKDLLEAVSKKAKNRNNFKDAITYTIQKKEDETTKMAIDITDIPEVHNDLFTKIFNELKPVK